MTVYVVRHADAKSRSTWPKPDHLRPLSTRGSRQAQALPDLLADADVRRIISSPAVRCIDTVRPLGEKHDVDVTVDPALFEGADGKAALAVVLDAASKKGDSVLCTHGDLVPDVLRRLARHGLVVHGGPRWPKGSTWVLSGDADGLRDARYLAPPA
jgi:phosphohistidine phosphatase SixA